MKLTSTDKKLLKSWGYRDEDLPKIERATNKTKTTYEFKGKLISREEVIEILGMETYLNGLSRSAFHWNSARENKKGESIYFDSSKLFK